jgi:hypothetical protein
VLETCCFTAEIYWKHVQDHVKDAEFLNKPLVNYEYMEACFADKLATGKFAMGSNEPLGKPIVVECPGKTIDLESGETNGEGFVEAQAASRIGGQGSDATTPSPSSGSNKKRKRASILNDEGIDATQVSNMADALRFVAGAINNTCHAETHPHRNHQAASRVSLESFGQSPGCARLAAAQLLTFLAQAASGFVFAGRTERFRRGDFVCRSRMGRG